MRLPFSSIEQDSAGYCQRAPSWRKPGSSGTSIDRAAGRMGLGGIMTGFSMPHFGQSASHSAPGAGRRCPTMSGRGRALAAVTCPGRRPSPWPVICVISRVTAVT